MVIAQSLGEYGVLPEIVDAVSNGLLLVESYLRDVEPLTWGLVLLAGVILWIALGGRR